MDHWDWYAKLRAQKRDPMRRWAEMEGKSATTRDDLYQSRQPQPKQRLRMTSLVVACTKVVVAMVNAWLNDRS